MFKKIKSLFVIEEGDSSIAKENSLESSPKKVDPLIPVENFELRKSDNASVKPDMKFTDLLLKAIESNNLDGFDYLEYKNSVRSVEQMIPDEGMRYKSAFEMAKTMGLSKEKLIQSANHYLSILASEDKKFKDALENQKAKQIQGRADQLATLEKAILEKQQMIEKMNKEIDASKSQLESIRNEINDAAIKIDTTNQQFLASYQLVSEQILSDIEKIKINI